MKISLSTHPLSCQAVMFNVELLIEGHYFFCCILKITISTPDNRMFV